MARILVGGYTSEMDGGAPGLRALALSDDLAVTAEAVVELASPSFVVAHPTQPYAFAVSEATDGTVSSLRTDDGLTLISTVPSGGEGGCHLAVVGEHLVVAHYTSGSVASLRIEDDGSLSGPVDVLDFDGHGPDEDRQATAHPHQVVSIGDVLLVPDLGSDAIRLVHLAADGTLSVAGESIALPPGTGPRHALVSHDHLLVTCELSAQVWVKSLATDLAEPGELVPCSEVEPPSGVRIYPSAITDAGDHVVVANRGVDTLAVFRLDPGAGALHQVAEVPAGGAWPRDASSTGDRLWVAAQSDDRLAVFAITEAEPYLELVGSVDSPSPAVVLPL